MNREEAIEILKGAIKKPNTKDGYLGQALTMGIEALENQKSLQAELEEIKAEMHKNSYMKPMGNFNDEFDEECRAIDMDDVNYILDKRITELKGEQEW